MTDVNEASFLQRLMEQLSSTQTVKLSSKDEVPVAVIGLQRYLSEQNQANQNDSFDVTVTDGVWRAKCVLGCALNHLVHRSILKIGSDINITQCSFVYNERILGHGYICIEKLVCGAQRSALLFSPLKDVTSLPMLIKQGMEMSTLLQRDAPLQVARKHYLALWNNDDPEGDIWMSGRPSSDTVLDVSKITLLCDLESSFRNSWKPLPLLVKIMHKSRLRYYGKFGLKIDYPYQAYFEVADQSGAMSLVLWNELCLEFYQRLNVGTVLYIQNYTLKKSYSNRSRPQMDQCRIKTFTSIEICLNPRNPTSVITVVSPKSVQPQWGLPDVAYQFTTRSEVEELANNSVCDVIGLVTFVGRVERVKSRGNKGPEKYWTYRWVHAVDGTSDHPFILELFSSSQSEMFSHICPMSYLVCTQMRVCQVEGSLPYLTSSCETQMFVTGFHKGQPYVREPRVKTFIQWTKTLKDNVVLQKTAVGGGYCYPHAPQIYTQSMADPSAQIPLVAATDLKQELESLQYREHKRLAIQGQITAVRYVKYPESQEAQGKQGSDVCEVTVSDTHADPMTSSQTPNEKMSESKRKWRTEMSDVQTSCKPAKRFPKCKKASEGQEEAEENNSVSEEHQAESDGLCWESHGWPQQQTQVSEHLSHGVLHQDSVCQMFTLDEKSVLLQWGNLHPAHWSPQQPTDNIPPANIPGYFQITILGINKQIAVDAAYLPVVYSSEPGAVGLCQNPHGNTMLSCLSSGFLCPLHDAESQSETAIPEPEDILATAGELEHVHLVCVLDLCHLGGENTEVLISKVYKMTEISVN
ncbi:RPA-related protein RADX isoform X2 [Thalassophryne amazonica]|uniref:RPA-related protein RADX isoform X2 n=1 Tax=Thalassophryne amazonica TaxID=390379 RepID=UPI00147086C5|nr:RPA-related protein RADX isoform X2 [Thalassophryne amazonica]